MHYIHYKFYNEVSVWELYIFYRITQIILREYA